jgi:hypothetical protein
MAATEKATSGLGPSFPDPSPHERVARLSATLPLRPDADRVRHLLAAAFVEHTDDLWPAGDPNATPEWIAANVDAMLATLERLFAAATDDQPGSGEFLARLSWLPKLVDEIAADGARLDG